MKEKVSTYKPYNPGEFETRWQDIWEKEGIYHASETSDQKKFYCLDYFDCLPWRVFTPLDLSS